MTKIVVIVSIIFVAIWFRKLWADMWRRSQAHGRPALNQSDEWCSYSEHHRQITYHSPAKCCECGLSIELVSTDFALIERCRRGLVRRCPMCGNFTLRNKLAQQKGLGHRKSGNQCASC